MKSALDAPTSPWLPPTAFDRWLAVDSPDMLPPKSGSLMVERSYTPAARPTAELDPSKLV